MSRQNENRRPLESKSHSGIFFALALLFALSSAWAVWDESVTRRPWKEYQNQFNQLLEKTGRAREPLRIHQVSNAELGIVDRCQTCHRGIDRTGFEGSDVPRVLRTHPERVALLGRHHPVASFGCTVCHAGQGVQTKGVGFSRFDHGRDDPYWDRPLLSGVFVESTCVACHRHEDRVPRAGVFNRGRRLFQELRCAGCHAIDPARAQLTPAPAFAHLKEKTSAAFVLAWLRDPKALIGDTSMPSFWPKPIDAKTGRPFSAGSNDYAAWQRRRDRETAAVVAFIGALDSTLLPQLTIPNLEDPALALQGKKLFDSVGCRGCHSLEMQVRPQPKQGDRFGPNLARIGERARARWLWAWLAKPTTVWAAARMPHFDLKDDERAALVAFLVSLRKRGAPVARNDWPRADHSLVEEGRRVIAEYGCYGCHTIVGFEDGGPIAADLHEFGDKRKSELEWGDAAIECAEPELQCWTFHKLMTPRRFAGRQLEPRMPDFSLTPEDAKALSVFLLSQRAWRVPEAYVRKLSPESEAIEHGERALRRYNCRGCHAIAASAHLVARGSGSLGARHESDAAGALEHFYEDPSLAPPRLIEVGKKFQYGWLFDFFTSPGRIRPWLSARMPTFSWNEHDRTVLVRYFAALAREPYPFSPNDSPKLDPENRRHALDLFFKLQCNNCHEKLAANDATHGELAPDLALSGRRLRADWLKRWLLDPQSIQPGTKMPTFFPLEDDEDPTSYTSPCPDCFSGDVMRQVEALVSLIVQGGSELSGAR